MPLRFVLGRAGSGKTHFCLEEMASELRRRPDGPPLILLVPEQATFQMDRALVSRPGVPGTTRAQVLSFRRLAWRVLAETGGAARPRLDDLGKVMALRALLDRRRDQLRVLGSCAGRAGFLTRLAQTLSELHAYEIRHPQLEEGYASLAALGRGDTALAGKLHDLALLSRDFEEYLAGRWVDPDDYLGLLAARLAGSPTALSGARVWVDGFAGFTPQELTVLVGLSQAAEEVSVALCLDPAVLRRLAPGARRDDPATFHPTLRTYDALSTLIERAGVERADPVALEEQPRFGRAPSLAHLEKEYPNFPPRPAPGGKPTPGSVTLVAAESPRAEVAAAAREIVRLARDEGYRWREIAVVVRSLEPYASVLETTFEDYAVPCFIDRRRPVTHHPLVEFARSAVEVARSDWAADPVFRLLKTDLWPLPRSEVDLLENYVLAHGVRGRAWTDERPWRWRRLFALDETAPPDPTEDEVLARVDSLRRAVAARLAPFVARLTRTGSPAPAVRERAAALWDLIESVGVKETLESWRRASLAAGRPDLAQEHEQVLVGFANVLDQMVTNLGDQPAPLAHFAAILEAGLESLTLGLVPPRLDQVTVGAIDRSRQPDVRACFVLGLNDGVFPATSHDDPVFDDRERDELEDCGLVLAPASREKALGEDYLVYIALTRPSERLWVSYALSDEEGRALAPSVVLSRLRAIFPRLEEVHAALEPEADEVCAEAETLAGVARAFSQAYRARTPPRPAGGSGWSEAYNWLVAEPARRERARAALASLRYSNRPAPLEPDLAQALYGRPVRVSVSRLERYAGCPFSHFASAGLALEPRPRRQLKAPQIGTYYHAVLSVFARGLAAEGLDLSALDEEAVAERLERAVAEVAPRLESEVLTSTARYRYLAGQLKRTVGRTLQVLREHARRSAFRPVGAELRFSLVAGPAGAPARLRGVVDRLEVARGKRPWVRVIDFKSAGKDYNLRETLSGLDIQLPAYLLASVSPGVEWDRPAGAEADPLAPATPPAPAGAFYFPVADPYVRCDGPLDEAALAAKRLELVRLKGVVLDDPDVLDLMDRGPTGEEPVAPIGPFARKRDGTPRKSKAVLSRERMDLLLAFTLAKLTGLAAKMQAGDIDIFPARRPSGETACRFCDYRPLCRFDPGAGDLAHRLPRANDDEVWDRMAREVTSARDRGDPAR